MDSPRQRNESNFYIFPNTLKGKKYYFQARYASVGGKSSPWSNIVGVVAGDYNAPPSIASSNVDVSSYRGTIEVDIKDSWKAAMPSDIKEIRWWAKPRPSISPAQDWDPAWLDNPYKILKPNETFSINDVMMVPLVFDIWAVPIDISGNIPESISRCATGVQAVRPSQSRIAAEIDGVGPFNPDSWFSSASLSLKLTTIVAGAGDGTKKIKYSVRAPGGEWGEWQITDNVSVLVSILNQGITHVRWMTIDSLYDDMASDVFETHIKWDKTAPSVPGTPAKRVSSPAAITWEWTASTDSVSGVDHYEVMVYSGQTLPGSASGPFSVTGTSFTLNTRNDYVFQIKVRAVDKAGNASAYSSLSTAYYEDRIPPVIAWAINGDSSPAVLNENGWYDDASLVALLTASDDPQNQYTNESGVSSIFYSLDGGANWSSHSGASKSVALSEGVTHLSFYAVDGENNQSAKESVIIRYDKTAPSVGSWVASGCYAGDDRIFLKWANGSDSVSGLAFTSVYRNTTNSSSTAVLVATVPASQTMYMDGARSNFVNDPTPLIPGKTYYYWIKQEDAAGNMSGFSAALTMDMQQTLASFFANFLDNGSFERGDAAPASWVLGGASYVTGSAAHGGKYVNVTSSGILSYDYVFVQPSTTYCLSAYTKASGSPTVKLRVTYYNNSGVQIGSSVDVVSAVVGASWARVSGSFSSPSDANLSHAKLQILSSSATAISVDAVQWEQGGSASPFCDTRSISADRLMAHVIKGDHISAGAITADKIFAEKLSSIVADLGTVTAGEMHIGSGATSFHVNGYGDHWAGADALASAPFSVTKSGKMTAVGATLKTSAANARVEIFPDSNTGLIAYDDLGSTIFKVVTGGTDVGDVVIGNYAGGQGAKWDKSAGTFTVLGSLAVNSVDVGDAGFLKGGATGYSVGSGFWAGKDGSYHKFFIGDSSNYLKYNGLALEASGSFTFKSGTTGYDNIADGASYVKTTANQRDGGGYAYSGLDSSGQIKKAIKSDVLESGAPPTGNRLFLSSNGLYMTYNGYIKVKILPDGTWRMAENCDNAVGATNKGIEWTGSALNVRGSINADDISAGTLTGRTVQTSDSGTRVVMDGANNRFDLYVGTDRYVSIDDNIVTLPGFGDFSGMKLNHARGLIYKEYTTLFVTYPLIFSKVISEDNSEVYSTVQLSETNLIYRDYIPGDTTLSGNHMAYGNNGIVFRPKGYASGAGSISIGMPSNTYSTTLNLGFPDLGSGTVSAAFVLTAGDQTLGGVKTFSSTSVLSAGIRSAAGTYLSFGSTYGSTGYGIRDNSGTLEYKNSGGSWAAVGSGGGGTPGGSNTQVQFNDSGAFGGSSLLAFNKSTGVVTATKFSSTDDIIVGDKLIFSRTAGTIIIDVGGSDADYTYTIPYNNSNASFVMDVGAQTINGIKTFGSFPVTPSSAPTNDYQVANKKYVDDNTMGSHGMLSTAHSDTIGTGVTRGALLVGNSSLKWTRLTLGTSGYYLKSDGNDVVWAPVTASPGGSDAQVQYNKSGSMAGSSLLTFNDSTGALSLTKLISTDDISTGDKLIFTRTSNVIVGVTTPSATRNYTIPDAGGDAEFVMSAEGYVALKERHIMPVSPTSGKTTMVIRHGAGADSYAKLLLLADGSGSSFTDSSSSARAVYNSGSVSHSTSVFKFGSASAYYSGSNYLYCAGSSDFATGSGDFTVDAWIRLSSLPSSASGYAIYSLRSDDNNYNMLYLHNTGTRYELRFLVREGGVNKVYIGDNDPLPETPTTGKWYHVAVVKNGIEFTTYWNGKYAGTKNYSATLSHTSSWTFYIGTRYSAYTFNGYIDNFRFSNIARWKGDFDVPVPSAFLMDGTGTTYYSPAFDPLTEFNFNARGSLSAGKYVSGTIVARGRTPADEMDFGRPGEIAWNDTYLYLCTASNFWKKIALTDF